MDQYNREMRKQRNVQETLKLGYVEDFKLYGTLYTIHYTLGAPL